MKMPYNKLKERERMEITSITIPVSLVAEALQYDRNFSRFCRDAVTEKIERIKKAKKDDKK